jgi:hypothetical protein
MRLCMFPSVLGAATISAEVDPLNSHAVYTIPLAIALTVVLGPLFTRRDVYKICFLQVIAVSYTIPWYVRRHVAFAVIC